MAFEFRLPDIGEGVVEGEIVRWLVKEGDTVREDQPLVEVMTDKATVEIPSPVAGRITTIPWKQGQVVPVEAVLVVIEPTGAVPTNLAAQGAAHAAKHGGNGAPGAAKASEGGAAGAPPGAEALVETVDETPRQVLAAPAVRKLAREMGVELWRVRGSGPGGRVRKPDVQAYMDARRARPGLATAATAAAGAPAAGRSGADALGAERQLTPAPAEPAEIDAPPAAPRGALVQAGHVEERLPLRGLRKRIAEAMARSKRTAAHFTYVDEVDVTGLVALRDQAHAAAEAEGVKLTYLPFIVKACVAGLKRFPMLNASLDDEAQEIVLKRYYNVGVAVSLGDEGLIVPNVKDADRKSYFELAREIADLGERARAGKARVEDLQRGTFTITSLGKLGGLFATPIINHPEVAIMGVHKIARRPMCMPDGTIAAREMMWLSCSFDHRVVDGATGAAFVAYVKDLLEDPTRLLLAAA
ncbi:MAG TPA: dihydrolipoamide acetyltransferase family protein [Myxococcota bacterium]|jgi:pyruvate dehydrogenase E2 component (dihydrolipoamide acetyltransferase)|nr:dihydrolipoamide acetyltransferase family protein [Myxococcota bacterium]